MFLTMKKALTLGGILGQVLSLTVVCISLLLLLERGRTVRVTATLGLIVGGVAFMGCVTLSLIGLYLMLSAHTDDHPQRSRPTYLEEQSEEDASPPPPCSTKQAPNTGIQSK
jgi:hypothetical protein